MLKHKIVAMIMALLACVVGGGCKYPYTVGLEDFTPQVVLNTSLVPGQEFRMQVCWSRELSSYDSDYERVQDFAVKLFEDNALVLEQSGYYGMLLSEFVPRAGCAYSIEVTVPDYGIVTAETYVPKAAEVEIQYTHKLSEGYPSAPNFYYFSINHLAPQDITRSVILRAYAYYDNGDMMDITTIYFDHPFADQFNSTQNADNVAVSGSIMSFDFYVRFPYKNFGFIAPAAFSIEQPEDIDFGDWNTPLLVCATHIIIEVLTPSDDFDKYYKSAYEQAIWGNVQTEIFSEIFPVHVNVQGGLGIFAGYSRDLIILDLRDEQ